VRQRNALPYPLIVGDDPPYLAPPGHEVDHPTLMAGFEPIDSDPPAATETPSVPRKPARSATVTDEEATS